MRLRRSRRCVAAGGWGAAGGCSRAPCSSEAGAIHRPLGAALTCTPCPRPSHAICRERSVWAVGPAGTHEVGAAAVAVRSSRTAAVAVRSCRAAAGWYRTVDRTPGCCGRR